MGHYYLRDILAKDKDALIVTTMSKKREDPHFDRANLELLVAMVEATDDTYIFSKSIDSLIKNTLEMERFQYAYGWQTQWSKSNAYVIAPKKDKEYPETITFDSVTVGREVNPLRITEHTIALIKDDIDFLRTKVDNPTARYNELKNYIETFQFPTVIGRLPITLIRKVVSQNITAKSRALLSLQPITPNDADNLDKLIIRKVHNTLGFPFQPTTGIATLPVANHGFGFPSIARINAGLAIEGLSRDLNHHIPAYPGRRNQQIITQYLTAELHMDHFGPPDLMIPTSTRQVKAESLIKSLARVCGFEASKTTDGITWASDGSMLPAGAGIMDDKTITAAATGERTLVMRIPGRNVSILQGEQVGLIIALTLAQDSTEPNRHRLLTDHLNSVRLINDSLTEISQTQRLRYMNGRLYYRWILSLVERSFLTINYTPGHSNDKSMETRMNNEADHLASLTQKIYKELPQIQPPTFRMNDFTFFNTQDGWIESNIAHYVNLQMIKQTVISLGHGHNQRMSNWIYNDTPPPEYSYLKATSAHSAAVQLYARSGQLATADTLKKRNKIDNDICRLGCNETESP
ncbi:hypothetical protein B0H34DRAFT_798547 [Crassisporium funariophilum]|nr:hypothetical protein B0H34DRAFT_798547 [Crassisporium funariophilum]